MKVIDLLNKIANGELPKKIKYGSFIYERFERLDNTYNYKTSEGDYFEDDWIITNILNDEVEIIEDTPKEDKKINRLDLDDWWEITSDEDCKPEMLAKIFNKNACNFSAKINEIIDKVNGDNND